MELSADWIAAQNAPLLGRLDADLVYLVDRLGVDAVVEEVRRFSVAAPSWALGTGGTRFGRFPSGGEPRSTEEKVDDVAALNTLTGANRSISLHVPWDSPSDPAGLREYARARGLAFDAMNSNTFQDNPSTTEDGKVSYKFGSLSHTDPAVRRAAIEHNLACIELGVGLGSHALTVWLPDGTNHPGQQGLRAQFERVCESVREIHGGLPSDWILLCEYKPYEPAFYATVVNDWGTALLLAQNTGERARVLVDLGHHLPHTNVEQIVSRLAMIGRLGGFHFNDSRYGDDDLTAGSVEPFRLFSVFSELVGASALDLAFMIDASHNVKDPLEDLIQSTEALQIALAQALCVDTDALREAQERNDAAEAQQIVQRAFRTDVRPLVAEARRRNGACIAPLAAYRASGYRAAAVAERGEGSAATGL